MDGVSAGLGVVSGVIQSYTAVVAAYDLYLDVTHFPSTYQDIRIGFMIERYRLELWASDIISEREQLRVKVSPCDQAIWKLFECIFEKMLETFRESSQTMENYGHYTGLPKKGELTDWELLEDMSLSVKAPPKHSATSILRTVKFVLRDKRRMEQTIKQLRNWNDGLEKMTPKLQQESLRRRLRTRLSTSDATELQYTKDAAVILEHPDIELMAGARKIIETGYHSEELPSYRKASDPVPKTIEQVSDYRLNIDQFQWKGIPYKTNHIRAMATYNNESVIVDWRCCRDDTWRRQNPLAFRRRTENLTRILNSDLRPLNVAVLHCVGYLDQSTNVTGYAFRLPPGSFPGQAPVTLHHLLTRHKQGSDIPDLGERFELAKALASTIFEIHNIGWMHKNIQPKNILFWPKPSTKDEPDLGKPYLMGFDISRPNQPGEVSEKPSSRPEDDLYRHPDYKGQNSQSFRPSFDMYSLGVIMYEIGLWRVVAAPARQSSSRPPLQAHTSDPNFIENVVMNGPVMELKRFTGGRYRDAVMACLNKDFDSFWDMQNVDAKGRLQAYLDQVQRKVVDTIAVCNA